MKLNSARIAWHDCYLDSQVSPLERWVESAQLMANIQHTSKLNTTNKAAHQAQAGIIQSAIGTLPKPLQVVGHWLYAPAGSFPAGYENVVWQMVAVQCGITDQDSAEWHLVRCAIHAYREMVLGRETLLKRPRYIAEWLEEQNGIRIDSRNFFRGKLGKVHATAMMELDELDKAALKPVAEAIIEMKSELAPGEECMWGDGKLIA